MVERGDFWTPGGSSSAPKRAIFDHNLAPGDIAWKIKDEKYDK